MLDSFFRNALTPPTRIVIQAPFWRLYIRAAKCAKYVIGYRAAAIPKETDADLEMATLGGVLIPLFLVN